MERFLKSRYRIGEKIGQNSFSNTYKAYLMGTEVPVVVKIYKRAALNSPLINKLRPKVTKIISLDHPNIARVIDGDYGWQGFYFVREFIEGDDLDQYLLKGLPSIDVSIDIMKQMLSALAVAHGSDLIHGALSSSNVFMVGYEVKIADLILEPDVRINPTLLAEATSKRSDYMAPEQIKGENASRATDIYSAGIIFYQLLTGRSPFMGNGDLVTALSHLSQEIKPPSRYKSEIPQYVDDIVMKMLERDPLQRINNVNDVLDGLINQRLVFKLPTPILGNLIYEDDAEPIIYDEPKDQKKEKKPKIHGKNERRLKRGTLITLLILIAIAAGLWYAFFLSFISMR